MGSWKTKLLVAGAVGAALVFGLVKLDVWYATRQAEQHTPQPETATPPAAQEPAS